MAESTSEVIEFSKDLGNNIECAVCLQPCIHPAQLPCGHIFCFLCVKGIANQSKRCAMCRQEIPRDFLDHPKLLDSCNEYKEPCEAFEGVYQWFYEGRNGWWQYDERTSRELENAYKSGDGTCELLIAGFLYVVDFDSMIQRRRNDPARRRRIKRDLSTIPKKGIAGIKLSEEPLTQVSDVLESPRCTTPPVTPAEGSDFAAQDSLQSTIEQMQALSLREDNSDGESDSIFPIAYLDSCANCDS